MNGVSTTIVAAGLLTGWVVAPQSGDYGPVHGALFKPQDALNPGAGKGTRATGVADAPIEAALQRLMLDVNFEDVPLDQALDFVRETMGVNAHVRWRVLAEAGVQRETPITVHLKNLPVERVLRLVLEDAGGDTRLHYMVDDGVLLISTFEDLGRRSFLEVYDVRDLVEVQQRAAGPRPADPGTTLPETMRNTNAISTSAAVQNVLTVIQQTVEPDAWTVNGGSGSIGQVGTALVVHQSDYVHAQIRDMLAELRRATERGTR